MKIYVIGVEGVIAPYVMDGFARGFAAAGCEVQYYKPSATSDLISEVRSEANNFSPDFIVSYRSIAALQVGQGQDYLFERMGLPVIFLFYDNPFYSLSAEALKHFKQRPEMYHFFVWDTEYIDLLREEGIDAEHLMLAVDETVFSPSEGEMPPGGYKFPVSFVGNLREKTNYPRLEDKNLRDMVAVAFKEKLRDHSQTLRDVVRMHFPHRQLGLRDYTAVNWHLHGESPALRWRLINGLGKVGLHLFGSDAAPAGVTSHDRVDYLTELPEVYRRSKINLSINSFQLEKSTNNRFFDVAGVGGFVLAERKPDLFTVSPGTAKDLSYGSPSELREKVDFFLRDDRERSALAETLHKDILAAHTYRHRAQYVLDVVQAEGNKARKKQPGQRELSVETKQSDNGGAAAPIKPKAKEYTFVVPAVVEMVPAGLQRALDVGCSGGALGHYLKTNLGFAHVSGIEYSAPAAAKARNYLDNVFEGDACTLDLPEEYNNFFDIVIYADVLEHLYDPWSAVRKHMRFLRPGGYMLASIPNLKNLFIVLNLLSDRFDYTEVGLLDNTHLRFFTGTTAVEMFTEQGMQVVQSRRSIRDAKWHADLNNKHKVNPALLAIYEKFYQKHIRGEDCAEEMRQHFSLFQFSNEAVADLLTVQFHLLFQLPQANCA